MHLYIEGNDKKTPGSLHESKLQGPCGVRMDSIQGVALTDFNTHTSDPWDATFSLIFLCLR